MDFIKANRYRRITKIFGETEVQIWEFRHEKNEAVLSAWRQNTS